MPHIQTDNQPVTQITVIEPEPGKQAEALSLITGRACFMARQPAFISISIHRSLDGTESSTTLKAELRSLEVGSALMKFGITGATMAGGHGNNGKQSDLEAVMSQK